MPVVGNNEMQNATRGDNVTPSKTDVIVEVKLIGTTTTPKLHHALLITQHVVYNRYIERRSRERS